MRFLKAKILRANQLAAEKQNKPIPMSINENPFSSSLSSNLLKLEENQENSSTIMSTQPSTKIEHCDEYPYESNVKIEIDENQLEELSLQSTMSHYSLKMEENEGIPSQYPFEQYSVKIENEELLNNLYNTHISSVFDNKPKNKKSKNNTANEGKSYAKNVDLNFIKAIIAFANSHVAIPYLKVYVQQEGIKFSDFIMFIGQCKDCITNGVQIFRSLLIGASNSDPTNAACIRIFKAISEIFIKCFSVNWITNSRLTHKVAYLKYRFKMLKRIQNPEQFAYVQRNKAKSK